MIRVLIIDDEKIARDVVKSYLSGFDDYEVVGECSNGFEGVKSIHELKPDLVFLDIQMPKINGFEMLELVEERPVVIFSTAFDQYALKAFEESAVDYLLKPYSRERFAEALNKAQKKIHQAELPSEIDAITQYNQNQSDQIERIVVRLGTKIVIIPVQEIDFIEAQDDYVEINTMGSKYLKQLTMKYLESTLPKDLFVRTHRSFIAAINQIDRLEAYSKDSYIAKLKTGDQVSVSRSGYALLKERLDF